MLSSSLDLFGCWNQIDWNRLQLPKRVLRVIYRRDFFVLLDHFFKFRIVSAVLGVLRLFYSWRKLTNPQDPQLWCHYQVPWSCQFLWEAFPQNAGTDKSFVFQIRHKDHMGEQNHPLIPLQKKRGSLESLLHSNLEVTCEPWTIQILYPVYS